MKKALIAAAVAGAFVAPTAMAAEGPSVNIYLPYALTMGDTENNNGATSTADESVRVGGGARLMFTWSDQLNNGMTLGTYMSLNIFGADSAGNITSRNSNMNLTGEFGTIAIGTNEHFFEIDAITDGYGADWALNGTAQGGEGLNFQRIGRTGFNFTRRDSDSIWWTGPQMNNLQLRAAYIFGAAATANDGADPEGYQIGATYSMGGLSMKVAHASYDDYNADGTEASAAAAGTNAEGTQFVFGYDFGSFSASVGMISMEQSAGAANTFEAGGYFASFIMPVEGGRIIFNMGELGDQDNNSVAINDSGISGYDIGYQHDLSANTYSFVRYQSQSEGANFNNDVNAAGADIADTDADRSSFMAGIVFSY
jgi:hypothetical protein